MPSPSHLGSSDRRRRGPVVATVLLFGAAAWLATSGSCAVAEPGALEGTAGLEIPPYLLELQPHAAVLAWTTPEPVASTLVLRSAAGVETRREESPRRHHRLEVTGLAPGRTYRWRIDELYEGTWTTPDDVPSFTAVAIGHTHGSESPRHYPDELTVARIAELRPELVLHAGDATYHATDREFARYFFRLFAPISDRIPIYVSPANHDSGWPFTHGIDLDSFRRLFPRSYGGEGGAYYSFEHKGVKVVCLSYETLGQPPGSPQYRWLARELERPGRDFTLVMLGAGNMREEARNALFEFLAGGPIDAVLGGDSSGLRTEEVHGIPFFFTGTHGAKPHPLRWIAFEPTYFVVQTLDSTGQRIGEPKAILTRRPSNDVADLLAADVDLLAASTATAGGDAANSPRRFLLRRGDLHSYVAVEPVSEHLAEADALRLRGRLAGEGGVELRLFWRAAGTGRYYRWQSAPFVVDADGHGELLLPLPRHDPFTGRPLAVESLRLHHDSGSARIADLTIEDLSLVEWAARP